MKEVNLIDRISWDDVRDQVIGRPEVLVRRNMVEPPGNESQVVNERSSGTEVVPPHRASTLLRDTARTRRSR